MKLTNMGYIEDHEDVWNAAQDTNLVRTAQEQRLQGISPDYDTVAKPSDFYVPQGVLRGQISIQQARDIRTKRGYITTMVWLNFGPGYSTALKLEDLDPETGMTLKDPTVLGAYRSSEGRIATYPERDLTAEFNQAVREASTSWLERKYPLIRGEQQSSIRRERE